MKRSLTYLTIVAVLALSGCSGSREAQKTDIPPQEPEAPAIEVVPTAPRCETMTVSCGYEGLTATGQVRMQQDSAIWVSVSYFFELGRAMATRDSVFVDAKMMGKSFRGTYADVAKRTGVKTNFNDLQAMLGRETAGDEISAIAKRLGYDVDVRISKRKKVDNVTFPFTK